MVLRPDKAEKAMRHARHLGIMRRRRESAIGEIILKLKKPIPRSWKEIPDLIELGEEFTSKKGRALNWTEDTTEQRLKVIQSSYKDIFSFLHSAHFLSYAEGSEMLHGSLYGVLRFIGLLEPEEPARTEQKLGNHIARQHKQVLLAVYYDLLAVIFLLEMHYGIFEEETRATVTLLKKSSSSRSKHKDKRPV
jgi:hypothetical protein